MACAFSTRVWQKFSTFFKLNKLSVFAAVVPDLLLWPTAIKLNPLISKKRTFVPGQITLGPSYSLFKKSWEGTYHSPAIFLFGSFLAGGIFASLARTGTAVKSCLLTSLAICLRPGRRDLSFPTCNHIQF